MAYFIVKAKFCQLIVNLSVTLPRSDKTQTWFS